MRASKDSLDSWDGELGLLGSAPLLSFSWSPLLRSRKADAATGIGEGEAAHSVSMLAGVSV